MPDGSSHSWESSDLPMTPAEAVAAILARADLDRISNVNLTHMTDEVRQAIQAAQAVAPSSTLNTKFVKADPERIEFWMPGC